MTTAGVARIATCFILTGAALGAVVGLVREHAISHGLDWSVE